MDTPATPAAFLVSDIIASRLVLARTLAAIVNTCARDVGLVVQTKARSSRVHQGQPVITLHLPAEFAANQHPAWCLACRIACFCPDARTSVVVHSEQAFNRVLRRRHHEQTA